MQQPNDGYEELSEINVTPFVDVLLVLLIIFMITAPLTTQTIDIQLPEEKLQSQKAIETKRFIVAVNRQGQYSIENRKVSAQTMIAEARKWHRTHPKQPIFIEADKASAYGKITRVMASLKNVGITNIGLLVKEKQGQ